MDIQLAAQQTICFGLGRPTTMSWIKTPLRDFRTSRLRSIIPTSLPEVMVLLLELGCGKYGFTKMEKER